MRLRSFTAANMTEAMRLVRETLGDDAVILGSRRGEGGHGVEITAAADDTRQDAVLRNVVAEPAARLSAEREELVQRVLSYHGVADPLAGRIARRAAQATAPEAALALAEALQEYLGFQPLEPLRGTPVLLVGPPGVGKTTAVARLAARDVMQGRRPVVATADTQRAGGQEQLAAFARLLNLEAMSADTVERLHALVTAARRADAAYVDSAGVNPYDRGQMDDLAALAHGTGAEPVLVLAAGTDAAEAADLGEIFRRIGCRRMLVTRLDAARRFGGLLSAAVAGDLAIAAVTAGPSAADPPTPLDAAMLARVLFNDPETAGALPAFRQEG